MNAPPPPPASDVWRSQAACVGQDPRLFTDPRPDSDDTRRAVATCRSCVVRQPCLTEALTHPGDTDVGIWGATTAEQRASLRPRHRSGSPNPPAADNFGLYPTLSGDLTDLTGRAVITRLPTAPHHLVLIDDKPSMRTADLAQAWRHIITTLDDYQPAALIPFSLTRHGELHDPTGRITITRLPVAPHLLVVHDGRPVSRHHRLDHARHAALAKQVTADRAAIRDLTLSVTARPPVTQLATRR